MVETLAKIFFLRALRKEFKSPVARLGLPGGGASLIPSTGSLSLLIPRCTGILR